MRALVTGAEGFVGSWVVRQLLETGHSVTGAIRVGSFPGLLSEQERLAVRWVDFDLLAADSLTALARLPVDGVLHLAAVASGSDARQDPGYAWTVNAAGTARLLEAFGREVAQGGPNPIVILASTGEVYGQGQGEPHLETDPLVPCSPYAASKVGAEVAGLEVFRRTGLKVIVARAFPHSGPGQSPKYVLPALVLRLRAAKRVKAPVVKTGNLDPIRDFLDARDVAAAYLALLERGTVGEVYNIASGTGHSLWELFDRLAGLLGIRVIAEQDPALSRVNDLMHLVGDPSRLRRATGWAPARSLDQMLKDLLDAEAG